MAPPGSRQVPGQPHALLDAHDAIAGRAAAMASAGIGEAARRHLTGHRHRAAIGHPLVLLGHFDVLRPTARPQGAEAATGVDRRRRPR